MSINSVQTNAGAMIALQSLNKTTTDMAAAQKQVSTGYRVADATDDGAAFAVAQSVRSTVSSLTTANQQLGNVQGLITTTQTGLTSVSNTMASMREVLVSLGDGNLSTTQRAQYTSQYNSLLSAVKNNIADSGYNGKTLIGSGAKDVLTIRNEAGDTYTIATFGGAAMAASLALATGTAATATAMRTLLTGAFDTQVGKVGTALNTIGSEANFVSSQITFNNNKVDSLNAGLGSLVDADLAKESAQLQALQIRQQLGTQALSMANQAPQALLSLFK
jgi:flagellin